MKRQMKLSLFNTLLLLTLLVSRGAAFVALQHRSIKKNSLLPVAFADIKRSHGNYNRPAVLSNRNSKRNLFEFISYDGSPADGAQLAGKLFFLAYIGVSTLAGLNELRKRAFKASRRKGEEEEEES